MVLHRWVEYPTAFYPIGSALQYAVRVRPLFVVRWLGSVNGGGSPTCVGFVWRKIGGLREVSPGRSEAKTQKRRGQGAGARGADAARARSRDSTDETPRLGGRVGPGPLRHAMDIAIKFCGLTRPRGRACRCPSRRRPFTSGSFLFSKVAPAIRHARGPRAPLAARGSAGNSQGRPDGRFNFKIYAGDAALDALTGAVPLDMLQLHGHEGPERVAGGGARAPRVAGDERRWGRGRGGWVADLAQIDVYSDVGRPCLLIDAKPPGGAPTFPAAMVLPSTGGCSRAASTPPRTKPWMLGRAA